MKGIRIALGHCVPIRHDIVGDSTGNAGFCHSQSLEVSEESANVT